jgi:ubiquinone/menaquinone biosynthesis C-methylase UbiE
MNRPLLLLPLFLLPSILFSQNRKQNFCGWRYEDTAVIRHQFERQVAFLRITDKDTIVDIGSSSGSMEGCLGVIGNYRDVNFVLVDIDSGCLSRERVGSMNSYYEKLKGRSLGQQYTIVNNTVDSLWLPANNYRKAWLMNTLHEIPDKQKMVRDIAAVLKAGGELVLLEILSRPKHTIHGGCRQPLMNESEIKSLLEQNGFTQTEVLWNPTNTNRSVNNPYYMVRFIKN